jgi:hypothetical protein
LHVTDSTFISEARFILALSIRLPFCHHMVATKVGRRARWKHRRQRLFWSLAIRWAWLAYGLELVFAETPQIGIVRKIKTNLGLVRDDARLDAPEWTQAIKDLLPAKTSANALPASPRKHFYPTG